MFTNCKQIISKIEQSSEPQQALWILEDADKQETFETLKKESKLHIEVGLGRTPSILEFSLGDHTETDHYGSTTEYLSLNGKLIKRGSDSSSSFYTQVYCRSSGTVDNFKARLHENPLGKIFHFGDPTTCVAIVPDLFALSSRPRNTSMCQPPPKKTVYEIPNRLSIGIVVTPLFSTSDAAKLSLCQQAPDIHLNIPVTSPPQYFESLPEQFGRFYLEADENYSDLKLESRDGIVLKAHKFVLAARSKKFHDLVEEHMKDNNFNGTIKVLDVDAKILMILMHWLYSGKLQDLNEKILQDLITAAVKYDVTDLQKALDEELIKYCRPENMLQLFQLSKQTGMSKAKTDIAAYIKENIG